MNGWLYEDGIGEERALLIDNGRAIAARLSIKGNPFGAGAVIEARLLHKLTSTTGLIEYGGGSVLFARRLPHNITEGSRAAFEVVREPLTDAQIQSDASIWQRRKMAVCEPAHNSVDVREAPSLYDELKRDEREVVVLKAHEGDRLEQFGWHDILESARSRIWTFARSQLLISPTPGMTVIDIDGPGAPRDLAFAAASEVARIVSLLDLGGSIGADFPTLTAKADRNRVTELFDAQIFGPHERTALNGFGFMQIVRKRSRRSIIEMYRDSPERMAALNVLRQAELLQGAGQNLLCLGSGAHGFLGGNTHLLSELERRTGRTNRLEMHQQLADDASFAQIAQR